MIDQLSKLQELLEELCIKEGTKFRQVLYEKYELFGELTELDAGFYLRKRGSEQFIFGASTDGVKTEIYPKGIIKANDKSGFNKFMKEWHSKMLEKRKEEIAAILSEIPDAD